MHAAVKSLPMTQLSIQQHRLQAWAAWQHKTELDPNCKQWTFQNPGAAWYRSSTFHSSTIQEHYRCIQVPQYLQSTTLWVSVDVSVSCNCSYTHLASLLLCNRVAKSKTIHLPPANLCHTHGGLEVQSQDWDLWHLLSNPWSVGNILPLSPTMYSWVVAKLLVHKSPAAIEIQHSDIFILEAQFSSTSMAMSVATTLRFDFPSAPVQTSGSNKAPKRDLRLRMVYSTDLLQNWLTLLEAFGAKHPIHHNCSDAEIVQF